MTMRGAGYVGQNTDGDIVIESATGTKVYINGFDVIQRLEDLTLTVQQLTGCNDGIRAGLESDVDCGMMQSQFLCLCMQ